MASVDFSHLQPAKQVCRSAKVSPMPNCSWNPVKPSLFSTAPRPNSHTHIVPCLSTQACLDDVRARLLLAMVQGQLLRLQRLQATSQRKQAARIARAVDRHFEQESVVMAHDPLAKPARIDVAPEAEHDSGMLADLDCNIGTFVIGTRFARSWCLCEWLLRRIDAGALCDWATLGFSL